MTPLNTQGDQPGSNTQTPNGRQGTAVDEATSSPELTKDDLRRWQDVVQRQAADLKRREDHLARMENVEPKSPEVKAELKQIQEQLQSFKLQIQWLEGCQRMESEDRMKQDNRIQRQEGRMIDMEKVFMRMLGELKEAFINLDTMSINTVKRLEETKEKMEVLMQHVQQCRGDTTELRADIEEVTNDIKAIQLCQSEQQSRFDELDFDKGLENQIKKIKDIQNEHQERLNRHSKNLHVHNKRINQQSTISSTIIKKVNEQSSSINEHGSSINQLNDKVANLDDRVKTLECEMVDVKDALTSLDQKIDAIVLAADSKKEELEKKVVEFIIELLDLVTDGGKKAFPNARSTNFHQFIDNIFDLSKKKFQREHRDKWVKRPQIEAMVHDILKTGYGSDDLSEEESQLIEVSRNDAKIKQEAERDAISSLKGKGNSLQDYIGTVVLPKHGHTARCGYVIGKEFARITRRKNSKQYKDPPGKK